MSAVHDPAALTVHLPAVPAEGTEVAIRVTGADLGFGESEFPDPEFELASELCLTGTLAPLDSGGFRLRGRLGGGVELECVRCLGEAGLALDEGLDLVWLPANEAASRRSGSPAADGGDRALEAADMNVAFFEEDRLDLRSAIWEQIHLALPVKPLCSAACAGLCPDCGADRNRIACECAGRIATSDDGPLGGLRALVAQEAKTAAPPR